MSSTLLNNLSNITHNGYLTLILGPMFAGKTTYLLKEIEKYETIYSKDKILVINHMSDNRYANNKISSHDKKMYPCLKNGTFQQKKFDTSNILNLIPFADNIIHLKSKCYKCGMEASFSKRIINDNQEILVGNKNYQPCCRKCL